MKKLVVPKFSSEIEEAAWWQGHHDEVEEAIHQKMIRAGRLRHDDLTGEVVAETWHKVAGIISIAAALSGIGILVTAGAGALWHRWAAGQHRTEIERMQKERHE